MYVEYRECLAELAESFGIDGIPSCRGGWRIAPASPVAAVRRFAEEAAKHGLFVQSAELADWCSAVRASDSYREHLPDVEPRIGSVYPILSDLIVA